MPKLSPGFIAFLQATGIVVYCLFIGLFMFNGNRWFGPDPSIVGPLFFLMLFMFSAVLCSMMYLGYAFYLFWEKKQFKKAAELVVYTTGWMGFYLVLFLLVQVRF